MRSAFPEYHPLDPEAWESLHGDGLIALDASALLHAYRLSPDASEAWLDLLEELRARLFVPFQAALEYNRNRLDVIETQMDIVAGIRKEAEGVLGGLRKNILGRTAEIGRSRVLRIEEAMAALDAAEEAFETLYAVASGRTVDLGKAVDAADSVHLRLVAICDSAVGLPLSAKDLEAIYAVGAKRYKERIPPGFEDGLSKETEARKYGDLVIWHEVGLKPLVDSRGAVFITEDLKIDWWNRKGDPSFGPHAVLRKEFAEVVGQPFWAMTVAGLMSSAEQFGAKRVETASIEQAEGLERSDREVQEDETRSTARINALVRAVELIGAENDEASEVQGLLMDLLRDELST